jgi:hypothetical protein
MESELSLPRTVETPMLSDRCDLTRRNDLDGSGNLSDDALAEFTRFFLAVSIAQVTFIDSLMQPEPAAHAHPAVGRGRNQAGPAPRQIEPAFWKPCSIVANCRAGTPISFAGTAERQARRIVSALVDEGVLVSESQRAPLRLASPAALASRWMPGLFPEIPA